MNTQTQTQMQPRAMPTIATVAQINQAANDDALPAAVRDAIEAMRPAAARAVIAFGVDGVRNALLAHCTHADRAAGRARPDGSCDRGGRWYPTDSEDADNYTRRTRTPSRSWPWSYYKAAFSLRHCEGIAGADHDAVLAVRRAGLAAAVELEADISSALVSAIHSSLGDVATRKPARKRKPAAARQAA